MLDRRYFLGAIGVAGGLMRAAPLAARDVGAQPDREPATGAAFGPRPTVDAPAADAPAADAIVLLADHVLHTRAEDIPSEVFAVTHRQLRDAVAVGLAGRRADGVRQLRDLAGEIGGRSESVLWGSHLRVPAHDAARANAAMVHALEFDDTFGRGFLHPSTITFPTALAVADMVRGVNGRELLTASALAIDVACRLAVSAEPGVDGFTAGWHNTTLIGYLTSALLASRLMKLDRDQTVNAVGIACHQAAGTAQSHIDGALTKRLGPGFASAAGVFAARLAASGVTGPRNVLEGEKGWYKQYHRGNYSRALLLDGLGVTFPALEVSFKPWPSCRGSHTSVDAALRIVADNRLRPEEIARVVVRNGPAEWPFLSNPIDRKRRPASIVEAQFSIPWTVAAALVDGNVRIAHFTSEALARHDILAMAQKIETLQDASLANPAGGPGQATVEVTARDGRRLSAHVAAAKGDPQTPMSPAEVTAKFEDCVSYAGMSAAAGASIRHWLDTFDRIDDVSRLTAAMAMTE